MNSLLLASLILAAYLCAAGTTIFAQSTDAESRYAAVLAGGSTEEKRNALYEIRNARSPELSRVAIAALNDSDDIVRATAAFSIIYLPVEDAERALLANLSDRAEIVRRETALALARIRAPRAALPVIAQIGKEKKNTEAKAAMVGALGEIGDVAAIDFLIQLLDKKPSDKTAFERRSAARSIGRIAEIQQFGNGSTANPESFLPVKLKTAPNLRYRNLASESAVFRAAVKKLVAVLTNSKETSDTRRETAFALGAIGDDSAVPMLKSSISDPDYYLAEICREALGKFTPKN